MIETAVILAIVVGLTQAAKVVGLPLRIVPLFALLCGVGIAFAANLGGNWEIVLQGIILGLTAIGLYEVGKTSLLNK